MKSKATGFLNAKKQPLRKHEDICVFYDKKPTYNPQFIDGEKYNKGVRKAIEKSNYGFVKEAVNQGGEKRYPNDVCFYEDDSDDWMYFKTAESEGKTWHPTQKPIALLEYLIKTYTNENETVLDNCMGSGSTGVACVNTNRNFIGIEKDDKYFEIAKDRISKAQNELNHKLF